MALKQEMEAVRAELAAIVQEIRSLGQEVKETEKAVAEHIVDPGEYHITMFERLRQVLKLLRKQLADSKTWLQTSNSRKRATGDAPF
jgi:phage-related minor tail protein